MARPHLRNPCARSMGNALELRRSCAFCEDGMKPRIYLSRRWNDTGWNFELWHCRAEGFALGIGATPRAAYLDFLALRWKNL